MCAHRPRVLPVESIHPDATAWLAERAGVRVGGGTNEEAPAAVGLTADAIVIRAAGRVFKRLLDHAPHLKVVGRHGVGLDNIDLQECTCRGIWVVHTPLANVEAVAEHAVGLILSIALQLPQDFG